MKKAKINATPVILCGGSGTRLWPLSRTSYPKQFICLTDEGSLFQQAAKRLANVDNDALTVSKPLIVTAEEHRFLAAEQLLEAGIEMEYALLEPTGRNTAPALTLAALASQINGQDPVLVVTPADQTVIKIDAFTHAIQLAIEVAEKGAIVIMGVTPDRAETGYGYIQVEGTSSGPLTVKRFVEKPDALGAQSYIETGNFFWNAGIIVLRASIWLKSLAKLRPDITTATNTAWELRKKDNCFISLDIDAFNAIPAESIDYAVLERAETLDDQVKMIPLDAGWKDLGNWEAVFNSVRKDISGNAHFGDVICSDSRNTLVYSTSRLVSIVGLDDLIVIETSDAVLVSTLSRSHEVKTIVKTLGELGRQENTAHRKVYRPWGWYDNIDIGSSFKVKRIHVKPGESISLQMHKHRAEHWVVVKGKALITKGEKIIIRNEGEYIYIPVGEIHRLANKNSFPLEIIEVQIGSYLEEDDIIRIEDNYGRNN